MSVNLVPYIVSLVPYKLNNIEQKTHFVRLAAIAGVFGGVIAAISMAVVSVAEGVSGNRITSNTPMEGIGRGIVVPIASMISLKIGFRLSCSRIFLLGLEHISMVIATLLRPIDSNISLHSRIKVVSYISSAITSMIIGALAGKVFDGFIGSNLGVIYGLGCASLGFETRILNQDRNISTLLLLFGAPVSFALTSTNIALAGVIGMSFSVGIVTGEYFRNIMKYRVAREGACPVSLMIDY